MIKIKNKEYKFRLGFKALLMFEEHTGQSVTSLGSEIKFSTVVDLAYFAMKSAGEEITRDFIIDAIDEDMSLINEISKLLEEDMAAINGLEAEAKK